MEAMLTAVGYIVNYWSVVMFSQFKHGFPESFRAVLGRTSWRVRNDGHLSFTIHSTD